MILILDANVIISALIRDNKSRELLTLLPFKFYSPDTLLDSIEKYQEEFIRKSGLSLEDFNTLLNFILEKVTIVKKEEYNSQLESANIIMGNIDLEDVDYIALALLMPNDGIWSDDNHFQMQNKIKIYRTNDIIRILDKDSNI